jgi:uncharacterized protein (TIGR00255 family)
LPSGLKSNEGWIRDSIQKNFSRGKIDLEIFYSAPQQNQLAISDDLIKAIKKNEESIKSRGLDLEKVSYSEILKIRDVLQKDAVIKPAKLKTLVNNTLSKLKKNRISDGAATKKDILKLINKMQKSMSAIKKLEKKNSLQMKKRFQRYKKELDIKGKDLNMTEIFTTLGKSDINEEVVRFDSHLGLVANLIKSKNNIGKKLDFYTQEMLREANTMSSKALISEIKNEAVDMKSSIERMKEHAQNIE